jgi:two-component system NtrC family sensor kinase
MREHASKVFDTTELLTSSVVQLLGNRSDEQIRADEAAENQFLDDLVMDFPHILGLVVVAADGHPLVAARLFPVPPDLSLADRPYFSELRDRPDLSEVVSRVIRDRVTDQYSFFQVSRPRQRDGAFDGIIAIAIQPDYFEEIYADFVGDGPLIAGLVRADGSILALHPFADVALEDVPPVQSFADAIRDAPPEATYTVEGAMDGNGALVAFRKIEEHPVYVAVAIPLTAIRDAWVRQMGWVLLLGVPFTLALVLLAVLALQRHRQKAVALVSLQGETALREAAEDQLRQAVKMEAIGHLSGGIAHDFNNLMTAIGGNLEILARKLSSADSPLQRYIDASLEALQRATRLTQRLLAFSRRQPLQPQAVDVNALVGGMSDLLHRSIGDAISVETVLGAGLWRAFVDANQLENALLNLAVNARDAMPDGGKLTIETANSHLDSDYLVREGLDDLKPGQYVLLAVSDTGAGMSKETVARAFDPFFTTKSVGQGTGLGLSMVFGFVKQSGGHVKIYSEVGHGTTVRLYLPRLDAGLEGDAEPVATPVRRPLPEARPAGGVTGTVLIVEDDAGVLAFERETLTAEGYQVLEAVDGRQAIGIIESDALINLIVTDVVLPGGFNGRNVADAAKRVRPGLNVLFTTGYTTNAIVHHGRLDSNVELLSKPFTSRQLVAAVRKLIAAGQNAGASAAR